MKKILLITTALIVLTAFFSGCKPPQSPPQGGNSASTTITITVVGDGHVEFKSQAHSFQIDKNKTWAEIKARADELIKYKTGFEHSAWKLNNASGMAISADYHFNADTTVYAESKQTAAPPAPLPQKPKKITITITGDEHAQPKADHTLPVDAGTKWDTVRLLADRKIQYTAGYENAAWKFNDASGEVIPDTHQFTTDTTVYAVSKVQITPPVEVTITVTGDAQVIHKSANHTFKVPKGETWAHVKVLAADRISYAPGYEHDTWKLTGSDGETVSDDYRFNTDTAVYAQSKRKMIIITVAGDGNVEFLNPPTVAVEAGKQWNQIESQAKAKIKFKRHHELKNWRLTDALGTVLDGLYTIPFNDDATVFAESKLEDIKLTITGDSHVTVNESELKVPRGTKWGDCKGYAETKLTFQSNYKLKEWRRKDASGRKLQDAVPLGNDMTVYAVTVPEKVTITIEGGSNVHIASDKTISDITVGTKWQDIKTSAKAKITGCDAGFVFDSWRKATENGDELLNGDAFEEDTTVYATAKPVPASEGKKIPAATIVGKDVSYQLPTENGSDVLWRGVFPAGRTVTLSEYTMGKYEVTAELWITVYEWAKENGYDFEELPIPAKDRKPMVNVSWRNCIAWCNAYTEMMYGNTDHCVYRESSAAGAAAVKSAYDQDADDAYFDQSKKGFRLPTETEWEYAARWQGADSNNAEQYGTVYLTNVNSASGATKPIGFEGIAMLSGETYESLRAETDRVAIFNKYYNGSAFVPQIPAVTELSDVGKKASNKLGLYDMSGNVAEWCWDVYSENVGTGNVTNPPGASSPLSTDTKRVLRGGNWTDTQGSENAVYGCMTGKRDSDGSGKKYPVLGFRLVWKE